MRRVVVHASDLHVPPGLDFEWLASDAEGHVALFGCCGGALPPEGVLGEREVHVRALEDVLRRPPSTRALFSPPGADGERWRSAAERGLFAYRCAPIGGPFRLAAAP
jgi:hypothetical protein